MAVIFTEDRTVEDLMRGPSPQPRVRRMTALVIVTTYALRRSVSRILARVPFDVHEVDTVPGASSRASVLLPDLVVVESGASHDEDLRELTEAARAPVMMIGPDRAEGLRSLEAGTVVDYVVSPVWERELRARAVRHARQAVAQGRRRFGELCIDLDARIVSITGREVKLTQREFDLVDFLSSAPGRAFTRRELLEGVWGSSPDWQQIGTVTEHVYRLRRKLESDPSQPSYILTVARGYRFAGGATEPSETAGAAGGIS